ncbi:MAG: cation/multidrug efflux pump [Gammaproteobacteria bacterium]|nr:cation/multidrug efflux pump [Gammaproteobacteria bacterium]NIR84535.1 cation/multidrug efflux pump [Gammaproteobacteria bacterium]NIR90438.1 cation/multidrug efflux pump [Gammaproteobacteria bacterium]NIU05586.1 cation/multidrug efflux pump [Gammaproteobacteria bacterium]NIV52725.1 cation/multidrug efflux pump [Gammaproteobacteria bacterium]
MDMTQLLAPVLVFAAAGLLLLMHAARSVRRRRMLSASSSGLSALGLLALGGLAAAVAFNLHTYQRLTHEQEVATLAFRERGPAHFQVTVEYPDTRQSKRYALRGEEWQLDARIIKWRGAATLLGLDTLYRVERLSGRYRDVARERSEPRSVFALAPEAGLDLWSAARRYERWLPWVDTTYGSATYLPMADGARYAVRVNQSGLLARPANTAARRALASWQ